MSDHNITTSQHLLKRLEDEMYSLYKLISQGEIIVSNLKGTWTALSATHKNFRRDIEND